MSEIREAFARGWRSAWNRDNIIEDLASWIVVGVWSLLCWGGSKVTGIEWQTLMVLLVGLYAARAAGK